MRKINDRIVGGVIATASMAALIGGGVWLASAAPVTSETPASVSAEPFDVASLPDANGLAAEQEAAAAAEVARLAAEAEAARVAAEAAAEAQRLADEQAAAEAEAEAEAEVESYDEPAPEPEPEPVPGGPAPGTAVHTICQVLEDGTQIPCQH